VISSATSKSQWPNQKLGPIDAINPKYPLPGAVGVQNTKSDASGLAKHFVPAVHTLPPLKEENYASVLITTHNALESSGSQPSLIPRKSDLLECTIHTCPTLIKQDLASLFPEKKFTSEPLTAVVLSHRTTNSPNEWSELAASEREALAETFTRSAIDVCATLKELGYWADFIDPHTGTPYLGAQGDNALMETDERMRHFGFELDDFRCCKVLRHPRWKHHVFVGLIFTDAPKDHPILSHF
jgi:hypothetical protein